MFALLPSPFYIKPNDPRSVPPKSTLFACGVGARLAVPLAHREEKGQICLWAGLACPAKACQPSLPNEVEDEMALGRVGEL